MISGGPDEEEGVPPRDSGSWLFDEEESSEEPVRRTIDPYPQERTGVDEEMSSDEPVRPAIHPDPQERTGVDEGWDLDIPEVQDLVPEAEVGQVEGPDRSDAVRPSLAGVGETSAASGGAPPEAPKPPEIPAPPRKVFPEQVPVHPDAAGTTEGRTDSELPASTGTARRSVSRPEVPALPDEPTEDRTSIIPEASEPSTSPTGTPPSQITAPFDDVRAAVRRLRTTVLRFEVRINALEQEVRGLTRTLREAVAGVEDAREAASGVDPERLAKAMDLLARRMSAEIGAIREGVASDLADRVRQEVRQSIGAELDARLAAAPRGSREQPAPPTPPPTPAPTPPSDPTEADRLRARIWDEGAKD